MTRKPTPQIENGAAPALVACPLCDQGFRRVHGIHIGSQRMGMIADTPCARVFAALGEGEHTARPWMAYVDGGPLRKRSGEARRFETAKAAYEAALRQAPRRLHP